MEQPEQCESILYDKNGKNNVIFLKTFAIKNIYRGQIIKITV
jgi:hypothetical protein